MRSCSPEVWPHAFRLRKQSDVYDELSSSAKLKFPISFISGDLASSRIYILNAEIILCSLLNVSSRENPFPFLFQSSADFPTRINNWPLRVENVPGEIAHPAYVLSTVDPHL